MATKRKVIDDATIEAIRKAPASATNAALAKKHGITAQYVSQIRRGRVVPKAARLPAAEVDARVIEIAGDGGVTGKRAKAIEGLIDVILLSIDDIKLQERTEGKEKRIATLAVALKNVSDCADSVRKTGALEAMTDEELKAALAGMASGAQQ